MPYLLIYFFCATQTERSVQMYNVEFIPVMTGTGASLLRSHLPKDMPDTIAMMHHLRDHHYRRDKRS